MPKFTYFFFILTLAVFCGRAFGGNPISYTLVDEGRALCTIVKPQESAGFENEAADLLKTYINKISGGEAQIVREGAENKVDLCIYIGDTEFSRKNKGLSPELDIEAFTIKPVNPKALVLSGRCPAASFYAVSEFLEKYLGVLFAWPGEDGTIVPSNKTLKANVEPQTEEPFFTGRLFSGMPADRINLLLYKTQQFGRFIRFNFHHNIYKIIPPEKYADSNPEFYAEVFGKRIRPADRSNLGWQACTTNPDFIKLCIRTAKEFFRKNPDIHTFSVSMNDGSGFCECKRCKALDIPGAPDISDRYFTFANEVAKGIEKEFPDKFISCLAYSIANVPPKRIKIARNVKIYVVTASMRGEDGSTEGVRDWAAVCENLGVYFWLHGKPVPKFYPTAFASYLRFIKEMGVSDVYAEYYAEDESKHTRYKASYELDQIRTYITSKLLWNPNIDIDAVLEEFCERCYGKAAPAMVKYYRHQDGAWMGRGRRVHDFGNNYSSADLDTYTWQDIGVLEGYLSEARDLAEPGPATKRIQLLQHEFEKTALLVKEYRLSESLEGIAASDVSGAENIIVFLEEFLAYKQSVAREHGELFSDFPYHVDKAINGKFAQITKTLGKKEAISFWGGQASRSSLLETYLQAQLALASRDSSTNIARNAGFEEPVEEQRVPQWSDWIRRNTSGKVFVDRSASRSGKCSVALTSMTGAGAVSQRIEVEPGQVYQVSCYAKNTCDPGSHQKVALGIKWYDPDGKWITVGKTIEIKATNGQDNGWEKLQCTFSVPKQVGYCVVMMVANKQFPGDTAWFDDVVVDQIK